MRKKSIMLLGIAVVGLITWQWQFARAQGTISLTTCQTITSNGNYVLQNNVSSSGTCFSIRGNVTNLDFDGNGKTITVSSGDALEVADFGSGTPHHVTIHDVTSSDGVRTFGNAIHHVTFENLNVSGITVYGSDDVIIQNNTVGNGGIQINDADNNWHPVRPIVDSNVITGAVGHTSKLLLEIAGGKFHPCPRIDAMVTNNTVTNHRNDPPPEATGGMRIRCATHSIVTGNFFRNTGTTIGLYLRDEADDGRFENNTFWVNSQEALRVASGNDDKTFPARNIFRNNVFRSDNGKSLYLQGIGVNNLFDHNIFWSDDRNDFINGGDGNTFDHNTFYVKSTGAINLFDLDTNPADTFTNNIFSYSGTAIYNYENFSAARHISNRNLFQNRAGAVSFGSQGSTLAAWRSGTGNDTQSIEGDPQFTNTTSGDFTLGSSSPARGAASDGSDLGAIPFGNTPPPPGASSAPISCVESWSCGAWSACSNNSQSRTCTDANSCGTTVNRPAVSQTCDSTAPAVSITSPTNNATVNGTVSITATASDNVGVVGVQFKLDGVNLGGEDTAAPYTYSWNTTGLSNASHALTAVARDAAGNTTSAGTVTVTVNNAACVEQWNCDAWSTCANNAQSRTCADANNCGTTSTRPPLTQSCTVSGPGGSDAVAPAAVENLR